MYDGKDYPMVSTNPNPLTDTVAMTKVDANTVEVTLKRAGKVPATNRAVVSPDGKTLTITAAGGTTLSGQPRRSSQVFEKQ